MFKYRAGTFRAGGYLGVKLEKLFEFRLEMYSVDCDDRPKVLSFKSWNNQHSFARDCLDISIDINHQLYWGADIAGI